MPETKELRVTIILLFAGMIAIGAWATYVDHLTGLKVIEADSAVIEEIRDLRRTIESRGCREGI